MSYQVALDEEYVGPSPRAATRECTARSCAREEQDARRARQQRDREAHIQAYRGEAHHTTNESGAPTSHQLHRFETDAHCAQLKFCENSGFDLLQQSYGTNDEKRARLLGKWKALDVAEISARVQSFNDTMNPLLPISACAACGVHIIGDEPVLLSLGDLKCLALSDRQWREFLAVPEARKGIYSIFSPPDANGCNHIGYYLHRI